MLIIILVLIWLSRRVYYRPFGFYPYHRHYMYYRPMMRPRYHHFGPRIFF